MGGQVGRGCPSILLRGTIGRLSSLPKIKQGATLELTLRVLHHSINCARKFTSTLLTLHHSIGCYGIYRGVYSSSIYTVYISYRHSRSAIYIIRGVGRIVTVRGAKRFHNICRILNNVVSPVSKVNPNSLRVSDLMRQITKKRIGRIILTLDAAVRNSAAGFFVCHGLSSCSIGVSIVTHNISVNSRVRCTSRVALKHSVIGHADFGSSVGLWRDCGLEFARR